MGESDKKCDQIGHMLTGTSRSSWRPDASLSPSDRGSVRGLPQSTSMDVNTVGGGADGPANGGAPTIGAVGGLVAPVTGAMDIWAARLPMGRPAMPGPVSKELLRAWWAHLTSAWS